MKSYDNSTYKMPIRAQNSNKGTFGKVLNFAGSKNYIGAAYLSTVSILKCGGGFAALAHVIFKKVLFKSLWHRDIDSRE